MAFEDETSYTGQQNISTFNGNILIDTARGEIAIRKSGDPAKRTVLDDLGLTTRREDGTYSARYGQIASTGEDVAIIADPGQDLRPEVG